MHRDVNRAEEDEVWAERRGGGGGRGRREGGRGRRENTA